MATCKGFRNYNSKCTRVAQTADGYCGGHQYQANPDNVCKGKTKARVPCYARAKKGSMYCREQHKPSFVQHVAPEDLRKEWDVLEREELRDDVYSKQSQRDAYTNVVIRNDYGTHLDHAFELQLTAEAANVAVVKRFDHGQTESQKEELVKLLHDDVVNRVEYLRITSALVNVLKGNACTRLVESWRAGDYTTTFTDCMRDAASSKYPGQRLREETGNIRKVMLKVAKQQLYRIDDKAEHNGLTEEVLKQLQSYRAELRR